METEIKSYCTSKLAWIFSHPIREMASGQDGGKRQKVNYFPLILGIIPKQTILMGCS